METTPAAPQPSPPTPPAPTRRVAMGATTATSAVSATKEGKKETIVKKPAKAAKSEKPAQPAKAVKAPKEKASKYPMDATIKVLAKENPKREGSAAHKKFAFLKDGMTVAQFLALGVKHAELGKNWPRTELKNRLRDDHIKLSKTS